MQLGFNLKEFRISRNLTQEDLATKLSKSKGVISNWEKGINRPDADTIGAICKIFSITPNELFGWEIEDNKNNNNEVSINNKYNQLDLYGKELVNAVIEIELKRLKNISP